MRIVYDVSPLSHPLTGVGNYVRGALAGLVEAAAGAHEIVAFAPTSPAGRKAIPRALDGIDVELRLVPLPLSQRWRDAWSRLGRPALERFLGGFDVFHYSDWMYPPQAGGVRATTVHDLVPLRFPEWVTPKTAAMHGAKYANTARTADLVFVNSEYTGRDVVERLGIGAERVKVAYPGVQAAFRPDGERADLGRPYVLTVATLEPRKNLGTLVAAHRLLGDELLLAVAGGSGWGDQPELRGGECRPARVRLRRRAGAALPRRRSRRLSVSLRGLRDADHGGDGLRGADGGVGARVDGRGSGCRSRAGRSGRCRGGRRRDP